MKTYGLWPETFLIDGESYKAELVDPSYAKKAGFEKIYAVHGLPPRFEDPLIRASQVCDVPHTWRVKECKSEDEVRDEIMMAGRDALNRDRKELNSYIITYVGDLTGSGKTYEFLAAGAIRDKLTRDYHNEEYPVVSRAIVAPKYRGKSLGSLIVEHRFKAVLHFFSKKPKAIHFGTESEKILHSVKKVEQEEGLKYVYIGNEEYAAFDGTHTVTDFLCFMPWFQEKLLKSCDELKSSTKLPDILQEFREKLALFMTSGIEKVSGSYLEELFHKVSSSVDSNQKTNALHLLEEVFIVKRKIGAADPK